MVAPDERVDQKRPLGSHLALCASARWHPPMRRRSPAALSGPMAVAATGARLPSCPGFAAFVVLARSLVSLALAFLLVASKPVLQGLGGSAQGAFGFALGPALAHLADLLRQSAGFGGLGTAEVEPVDHLGKAQVRVHAGHDDAGVDGD